MISTLWLITLLLSAQCKLTQSLLFEGINLDNEDRDVYTIVENQSYGFLRAANNEPWSLGGGVTFEIQIIVESLSKANGILLFYESNNDTLVFPRRDDKKKQQPWYVIAYLSQAFVKLSVCEPNRDGVPFKPQITNVSHSKSIDIGQWNTILISIRNAAISIDLNGVKETNRTSGNPVFNSTSVVVFGALLSITKARAKQSCNMQTKIPGDRGIIRDLDDKAKGRIEGCVSKFQLKREDNRVVRPLNFNSTPSEACGFKKGCSIDVLTWWDENWLPIKITIISTSFLVVIIVVLVIVRKLVLKTKVKKQEQEKEQMILNILVNTRLQGLAPSESQAYAAPSKSAFGMRQPSRMGGLRSHQSMMRQPMH